MGPQKVPVDAVQLTPPKPMQSDTAVTAVAAAQKSCLEGSALREAILAFLRQEADAHPEGCALGSICAHAKPTPDGDVRKAVEQLVEEGDVFTTIDDEHFSSV